MVRSGAFDDADIAITWHPHSFWEVAVTPSLVVLENDDDRFAPTRRVWNQHTYQHIEVSELGRIPAPTALDAGTVDDGFRVNHRLLVSEQCIPPWLAP